MTQKWSDLLNRIQSDEQYLRNLEWGEPRRGHPEGTIRAHIQELEQNLTALMEQFGQLVSEQDAAKLRVLIHVHDTFKPLAQPGVAIEHPQSHASLAASFLQHQLLAEEITSCDEADDLVSMVQNHDVGYALWRKSLHQPVTARVERFVRLLSAVRDWRLFSAFLIIDNCTAGKSREPLTWFFALVSRHKPEVSCWQECTLLARKG